MRDGRRPPTAHQVQFQFTRACIIVQVGQEVITLSERESVEIALNINLWLMRRLATAIPLPRLVTPP